MKNIYSSAMAREYDRIVFGGYYDYTKSVKSLVKILGSDHKNILELGIGTGNIALLLKKRGYSIFGIDNSPSMLGSFKKKVQKFNIPVLLGDVRNFHVDKKFDGIISHGGAFVVIQRGKQYDVETYFPQSLLGSTIRNIKYHLRTGGLFVVNIQPEHRTRSRLDLGDNYFYESSSHIKNRIVVKKHVVLKYNKVVMKQTFTKYRMPLGRFALLLKREGFISLRVNHRDRWVYSIFKHRSC